jgi:RNA polymerase sigma-70 factor (ECF subfamily)
MLDFRRVLTSSSRYLVADPNDSPAPDSPIEGDTDVSGDADTIAAQLRAAVARAVRRVCPQWLADDADDLTQIATTRVLARINQTSGKVAFTPGYLYRAVHSALVDEIRRRRRLREDPIDEAVVIALPRRREGREIREALKACLGGLVPSRRRAVMLHLQGHSAVEAGELLGCSRKQAENLIYRGLANLRACLAARGVTP